MQDLFDVVLNGDEFGFSSFKQCVAVNVKVHRISPNNPNLIPFIFDHSLHIPLTVDLIHKYKPLLLDHQYFESFNSDKDVLIIGHDIVHLLAVGEGLKQFALLVKDEQVEVGIGSYNIASINNLGKFNLRRMLIRKLITLINRFDRVMIDDLLK